MMKKTFRTGCVLGLSMLLALPAAFTPAVAQTAAPVKPEPVKNVASAPGNGLSKPRVVQRAQWLEAQGYVMPWQESHIGSEVGGLRLVSVEANVGDVVRKGQVLAQMNAATVEAELDAARAQMVEAEAALAQATATLERARRLAPTGGISKQDLMLYETQRHTAAARLEAARAQVKKQQLRLDFATLVAPDDGVISARTAVEGAIVQSGGELFRLIRQGRLEWRAEVAGDLFLRVRRGQSVKVVTPRGITVDGVVRQVSPLIDRTTGKGMVYIDVPASDELKAGLLVTGRIEVGQVKVLLVPETAVFVSDGQARVLLADGAGQLRAVDVTLGEKAEGWQEISGGLTADAQVQSIWEAGPEKP